MAIKFSKAKPFTIITNFQVLVQTIHENFPNLIFSIEISLVFYIGNNCLATMKILKVTLKITLLKIFSL